MQTHKLEWKNGPEDGQTPNLTNTRSLFQQYIKTFQLKKQLEEDYLKSYKSNQVIVWSIVIKVKLILKHLHYVGYVK